MKGISFDVRDCLWDAGFQHKGIKYRKKFKEKAKAEEWLLKQKEEVKKNEQLTATKLFVKGSSPLAALWDDITSNE